MNQPATDPREPTHTVVRSFNIRYSRQRFLEPMLGEAELQELAELERLCFPPEEAWDLRTLRRFASLNGAGLLRWYEPDGGRLRLVAFELFDCLEGEILTVDVHPDWRRRGIAARLAAECLAKLRELGHRSATCQVSVSNAASLELHRRLGFRKVQRLPGYYGPGRDAWLMRARLAAPRRQ